MSTIGGRRYSPGHHMMRDAMRQLFKEFPMFRCWPLLGIDSHLTWVGLMGTPQAGLTAVNDNHEHH